MIRQRGDNRPRRAAGTDNPCHPVEVPLGQQGPNRFKKAFRISVVSGQLPVRTAHHGVDLHLMVVDHDR